MVIEEFLVALGFELDKKDKAAVKEFQKGINDAAKTIKKLTLLTLGGSAALVGFIKVVSDSVDALGKQARALDLEAQRLDNLRFALEITSGSAEGLDSALVSLSKNISEAGRGTGSGAEIFGILGITPTSEGKLRKVDDVLLEILDKTKELSAQERIDYLEKLGLGKLNLSARDLSTFNDALAEASELSVVTLDDVKKAEDFNDAISRGMRVLKGFAILIASQVSPIIKVAVDTFKDWAVANREILKEDTREFFSTLGKLVAFVANGMLRMFQMSMRLINSIGGLNAVLKTTVVILGLIAAFAVGKLILNAIGLITLLTKAWTLLNFQAFLIPIAIGSLVALIILLADEIATAIDGGDTLFSELFKNFGIFRETIEDVLANIMIAWDKFVKLLSNPLSLDAWKDFFDGILGLFGSSIDNMLSVIGTSVAKLRQEMIDLGLIEGTNTATQAALDKGPNSLTQTRERDKNRGPRITRDRRNELLRSLQAAREAGSNSLNAVQKSTAVNSNTNTTNTSATSNQNVKVDINVKGDISGVDKSVLANEFKKTMENLNRDAMRNIETGISK